MTKPYHDKCEVISLEKLDQEFSLTQNVRRLIQSILNGNLILVPYDCDLNFEPCFKNGKKAHWALIHGFIYSKNDLNGDGLNEYLSNCFRLETNQSFIHDIDNINFDNLYVFAKHGKSTHSAIWNLKKLLLSNGQLNEIDEKRTSTAEYIIPECGISQTLSSKILVIFKS